MCGIVGGFTPDIDAGVAALAHRGPDAHGITRCGALALGHTRLAIRDLGSRSDQPFAYRDLLLVYNGELWNEREVRAALEADGYVLTTTGDTEVVAAALHRWGTDALLRLEGMFALAWTTDGRTLYLARDRFGEVPLHVARQAGRPFLFASERKALLALGAHPASTEDVLPGTVLTADEVSCRALRYYDAPTVPRSVERAEAARALRSLLADAVRERAVSDVPVCTLLSGGLDSALITALLRQTYPDLVAYTAVHDPKSRDLRAAREVASWLGIALREVPVPVPSADDLSGVVRTIEMPHKAQVEIGWPCVKLAEAMRSDGFKVTYSGEGSDELWASYGFCYHALLADDWHRYRKALFLSQARKNFPRANKVFMAHSVECRLPFLHTPLVEYALSLMRGAVRDGTSRPKAVLQEAVADLLPPSIVRRPKLAFQDGLGIKEAIKDVIAEPERFYRAEHARLYERQQRGPRADHRTMAVR